MSLTPLIPCSGRVCESALSLLLTISSMAPGLADMITRNHPPELTSLTKSLSEAFERRSQGAKEYVAPPRHDALKGALRAVREQTCGFMWELVLSAVEKRLYPSVGWTDNCLHTMRVIPTPIIQGLLDSLTAIQHLPENTFLRITTFQGISTILVWAHHILGLSAKVDIKDQSLIFGNGPVSIYINYLHRSVGLPQIALLNETHDPFFDLAGGSEEILLPVRQHPLRDYGTQVIHLRDDNPDRERQLAHEVVTSCISITHDQNKYRSHGIPEPQHQYSDIGELGRLSCFPSISRVLAVSKMLFASYGDVIDAIDADLEWPCAAAGVDERTFDNRLLLLTHIVLILGWDGGWLG